LTSLLLPASLTSIGDIAFDGCSGLTTVTVPSGVTSIGQSIFYQCTKLVTVTLGGSVTNIGYLAFGNCTHLTAIYCPGNAPAADPATFNGTTSAIIYYLPTTTGWMSTLAGRPTQPWGPVTSDSGLHFGPSSNQFGFTITWADGQKVVVQACTNLADPVWIGLKTNTLSGGALDFSDANWSSYPQRFYRVTVP
jgi:hypothetical protein